MKIYIAGKITGNKNYKKDFEEMKTKLERNNHVVLIPSIFPDGLEQEEYLHICFSMIDVCEGVMFLNNWVCSKGAKAEHEYAKEKNKKIFYEGNTVK